MPFLTWGTEKGRAVRLDHSLRDVPEGFAVAENGCEEREMSKLLLISCLAFFGALAAPVTAVADCSTRIMAGDHALFMRWSNAETTGTIFAKAEIKTSGRVVLRGAKVNYFETDNPSSIVKRDGYGEGSIALAPLCTGIVKLTITDRASVSEVVKLEATVMASGAASDPLVKGVATVDIYNPYPSYVIDHRGVYSDLELRNIRM